MTFLGQDWTCLDLTLHTVNSVQVLPVLAEVCPLSYSGFKLTAKPPPGTALSFSTVLLFTVFRKMT